MKQLFNQPIFSFLFLCISNTEGLQTADNVQIHIEAPSPETIEQPVENQQLVSNTQQDHVIKKTMSFKDFVLFLIIQGVILFFCKLLYGFGFSKELTLFEPTTIEIILTLISILLLIFYFFILSQYIKTYDHIPVSFSFFLIIFCFPFFFFFKPGKLLHFLVVLQESFNPLYLLHFSTFFQKEVKIQEYDNKKNQQTITIQKKDYLHNKMHFIGKIFLSIFVLFLIRIGFILKEKENKFNGFLFVFPKILSAAVFFCFFYVKKDQAKLKYNIYFSDPNIKIRKLDLVIERTGFSDNSYTRSRKVIKTKDNNIIVDVKVTIDKEEDIILKCCIVKDIVLK